LEGRNFPLMHTLFLPNRFSTPRSHPTDSLPCPWPGRLLPQIVHLKGKNESSIGHTMLFFFCCHFHVFSSSSLRLRGDFSLELPAEDMGKKAQSDSLYRCNAYFTFGFKMPFSMTTTDTISGISNSVSLPLYKFTCCCLQSSAVVSQAEFRKQLPSHHSCV
jgi:hypothetical protein